MKRTSVGYRTGFRVLTGDDHSQAATMVIGPGQYEGSPDNSHRSADQWLYVESGAGEAIINGKVRGDIRCPKSVALGSTARVIGNIETGALSIEPGATFEGECTFPASVNDQNAEANVEPEQACAVATVN